MLARESEGFFFNLNTPSFCIDNFEMRLKKDTLKTSTWLSTSIHLSLIIFSEFGEEAILSRLSIRKYSVIGEVLRC